MHHFGSQYGGHREPEKYISPFDGFFERVDVAGGGETGFGRIEILAAHRKHSFAVAHHHVFRLDAQRDVKLRARNGCCARAVDDHFHLSDLLACDLERVEQRGGRNDRRAVLVVVHDGDRKLLLEPLLDHETLGGLDVLEVDAAESDRDILDRFDKFFGIFRVYLDVEYVYIGEGFEQKPLAFHYRLAGLGSDVAEPQDGRPVGDDGDEVSLVGIFVCVVGIFFDLEARFGYAGRIGERKVFLRTVRFGRDYLDLAGSALGMIGQRFVPQAFFVCFHVSFRYHSFLFD